MKYNPILPILLIPALCLSACSLFQKKDVQNASSQTTASSTDATSNPAGNSQFLVPDTSAASSAATSSDNSSISSAETESAQIVQSAQDLESAESAIKNLGFAQAFQYAKQSYLDYPNTDAIRTATYAASRLTPIEITRMYNQAETHFERAILGQLRASFCAAQKDASCLETVVPETIASLNMIGETDAAASLAGLRQQGTHAPIVAVLLPLSGKDRKIGRAMLGAVIQAAGVYSHKPLAFDLRFFDTKSSHAAISGIFAEIEKTGANLILGPVDIQECTTAANLASSKVMIGFSPNSGFVEGSNIFQYSYAITEEAQQIAQMLVAFNAQKIVSISTDDAYAATTVEQLRSSLPESISIQSHTYPAKQTDLRELAKKAAAQSPDTIFLPVVVDQAERIMSFMAQENVWCAKPGTPQPKASSDTRRFVTCIATSAWAPVKNDQRFKFINEAIYLDYADAASTLDASFTTSFEQLYHRSPAVHEVLPFAAVTMLRSLAPRDFESGDSLQNAVSQLLRGSKYLMLPGARRITPTGTEPFAMVSVQSSVSRTIVSQ